MGLLHIPLEVNGKMVFPDVPTFFKGLFRENVSIKWADK